jgi:hypothetical protein
VARENGWLRFSNQIALGPRGLKQNKNALRRQLRVSGQAAPAGVLC